MKQIQTGENIVFGFYQDSNPLNHAFDLTFVDLGRWPSHLVKIDSLHELEPRNMFGIVDGHFSRLGTDISFRLFLAYLHKYGGWEGQLGKWVRALFEESNGPGSSPNAQWIILLFTNSQFQLAEFTMCETQNKLTASE